MSDGDLTQFNRVAADAEAENAANALTSVLLLITDGKKITGETNSAGKAPVNRGTKILANMIAGIRGALFGNVAGIAKRTLYSLSIDGVGGAIHTVLAGHALFAGTSSGTSAPTASVAGGTVAKDSVCLGWARCYWDGAAMVLVRGWNCRSLARTGTGEYTVVFQPTLADPTTAHIDITMGVNPSVVAHGFVGNPIGINDDGAGRVSVDIITTDPNTGTLLDTTAISQMFVTLRGY